MWTHRVSRSACTAHAFAGNVPSAETQGSVPIGLPLHGLSVALVDEDLAQVGPGEPGELCFKGPQVAMGYSNAPEQTAERFITMPWDGAGRWYRTGDLAIRLEGRDVLAHLGRSDDQVKVRGYRVELGEVEFALRRALDREGVAALAVPSRQPGVLEVVAFVGGTAVDEEAVREALGATSAPLCIWCPPRVVLPLPRCLSRPTERSTRARFVAHLSENHANT